MRAHARRPGGAARPAARRAASRLRDAGRRGPGSLHRRPGEPEPAGRRGRGATARVPRRRCAMARSGLGADAGLRSAAAAGGAHRHRLRRPRAQRRQRAQPPAGAARPWPRRRRRTLAAGVGHAGSAGRARARSDRRRDARQPAGAAGAAARVDAGRARGRVRAARGGAVGQPRRGDLRAAGPGPSGRDAAPAAGGRGRAGGGREPLVAGRRAAPGQRWRAPGRRGIRGDAGNPAEEAALIDLGIRVRFRHPLVRSAAYRAAHFRDRQDVHRALAEATDPQTDPDRRAWHRAQAASGPDEAVADELERSADRAQARGGAAAAAAFLARAAELTPDPAERGRRAVAAAQAKFDAAASTAALELLATAELAPLDELQRARLERLRAEIVFARTRGSDAPTLLLGAARRLDPLDAAMARETHLDAMAAAMFAGRLRDSPGVREAAAAAQAAPPAAHPPRAIDLLLDGLATRFTDGYFAGVPPLRKALDAFRRVEGMSARDARWLWLACRIAQDLWDDELWAVLATRGVHVARETGALGVLPIAATYRASLHVHAGDFDAASSLIAEADSITRATGMAPLKYASLMLAAGRGNEADCLGLIESGRLEATARGEGMGLGVVEWATAVLYNGGGRYADALAAAGRGCEHDDVGLFAWALVEMIEAGVRCGATDAASAALDRLSTRTRASGTDWALGIEACSRALLSAGRDAETHYREAAERLARSRGVVHLARARLLYGEWLRRENRRVDAREQLRAAYDQFGRIGAEAFAERARGELLATGETAPRRTAETRDVLTPQEAQIARMASDRQTNPEIAAKLFISPRTVEYHLHKVFTKLDVTSRKELRGVLAGISGSDRAAP